MKKFLVIIFLILLIPLGIGLGIGFDESEFDFDYPAPQPNYSIQNVSSADFWDDLDYPNTTQMENSGAELNIKESWLTSFGNTIWCALTGCSMTGNLDLGGNNITNAGYGFFDIFQSEDLRMYDSGEDAIITTSDGRLLLSSTDNDIVLSVAGAGDGITLNAGAGGDIDLNSGTGNIFLDSESMRLEIDAVRIGIPTDGNRFTLGASDDLQLSHSGGISKIITTTGDLLLQSIDSELINISKNLNVVGNATIGGDALVTGNITTSDTGFFGWLGNLTNRIIKIFVQDIDVNGTLNSTGEIIAEGITTGNLTITKELKGARTQFDSAINVVDVGTGAGEYMRANNGMVMSATRGYSMPRDGAIVGLSANLDYTSHTTGTLYAIFSIRINDVTVLGETVVCTTPVGRKHNEVSVLRGGTLSFNQGDLLTMYIQVTGAGTGQISYPVMVVEVQYDD